MNRKLGLIFTFSFLFLSICQLGTTRDGVVKENISDITNPNSIIQEWELVIILEVWNFSYSEKIAFPVMNISEEIQVIIYSAQVNSSRIDSIILDRFLGVNTALILLFENNIYQRYLEV